MNQVLVADARKTRKPRAPELVEVALPCGRRALVFPWDHGTIVAVYVEAIADGQPSGVCDRSWLWGATISGAVKKWTGTLGKGTLLIRCETEEVLDAVEGAL